MVLGDLVCMLAWSLAAVRRWLNCLILPSLGSLFCKMPERKEQGAVVHNYLTECKPGNETNWVVLPRQEDPWAHGPAPVNSGSPGCVQPKGPSPGSQSPFPTPSSHLAPRFAHPFFPS